MLKSIYNTLLLIALAGAWLPHAAHAEFREEGIAIIGLKGPNALQFEASSFTAFADRYMLVSGLTRIYSELGEPISLVELRVPCEARILYRKRTSDGLAEAISVNVQGYVEGQETATEWSLPELKPLPPQ